MASKAPQTVAPAAAGAIAPEPFLLRLTGLGRIAAISADAAQLLGRSAEDLVGIASAAIVVPEDVRLARQFFANIVANPGQRQTVRARLRVAGAEPLASELAGMNQGSVAVPDILVVFRPPLPEPPGAPAATVPASAPPDAPSSTSLVCPHTGLDALRECVGELDRLLNAGVSDFMLLLVEVNPSSVPEAEVAPELRDRLARTIRDTDRLFCVSPLRPLLIIHGVQDRAELGIVMDRVTATLGFPFTETSGRTSTFDGRIGVALPRNAITGESLIHWAQTQLNSATGPGEFAWSVETRASARE